jgi:hypothetical protein
MEPKLPQKDTLTKEDLVKWGRNTLIFSAPALIAFLLSIQSGGNFNIAIGFASQALIAALIDLLRKYSQGI